MQNFSEKPQNIFQTNGPVGNGPRRNATLIRAYVQALVIGAGKRESRIGNGTRGSKLDKKCQINFSPAYLFNKITVHKKKIKSALCPTRTRIAGRSLISGVACAFVDTTCACDA